MALKAAVTRRVNDAQSKSLRHSRALREISCLAESVWWPSMLGLSSAQDIITTDSFLVLLIYERQNSIGPKFCCAVGDDNFELGASSLPAQKIRKFCQAWNEINQRWRANEQMFDKGRYVELLWRKIRGKAFESIKQEWTTTTMTTIDSLGRWKGNWVLIWIANRWPQHYNELLHFAFTGEVLDFLL